ncbi:MAG TPA: DnaD domain-containing protein [Bacillota bacterium]|nr:DnaD domain-containing protein [Bacillota bacterium]
MINQSIPIQQIVEDQMTIPMKILTDYKSLGLNEIEVLVILQLHRFSLQGNPFPTPEQLVSYLTVDEKTCAHTLRKLIQQGILSIEQSENEHQQISEAYSLQPLWEKLYTKEESIEEDKQSGDGTIFILFEQEFGRPLSPFEIEMINTWLDEDQMIPALIKAALRESVLMGKLNFKYIDRILRTWKKKGIHTVEQARMSSRNFHKHKTIRQPKRAKRDTSIYYNWLEGED